MIRRSLVIKADYIGALASRAAAYSRSGKWCRRIGSTSAKSAALSSRPATDGRDPEHVADYILARLRVAGQAAIGWQVRGSAPVGWTQ